MRRLPTSMSLGILPPAGGFASPAAILKALKLTRQIAQKKRLLFSEALAEALGASLAKDLRINQKLILCGSGTVALWQVFKALRGRTNRPFVAMAAYTCPDIACAAVRAGFKVYPVDIDEKTLELRASLAAELPFGDIAAIVMSNLYGLPDSLKPWKSICEANGCLVVDDACQSAYSLTAEGQAGCRTDVGIFSFGRGKAVCGVGGGLVLARMSEDRVFEHSRSLWAAMCASIDTRSPTIRLGASLRDLVVNVLAWVFENPRLYPLPAKILGCHLGETRCDLDFSLSAASAGVLLCALGNLLEGEKIRRAYSANASLFHDDAARLALDIVEPFVERNFSFSSDVVPIRYPILLRTGDAKLRLLREFKRLGLGVSGSYPKTLLDFEEISSHVERLSCEGARTVASEILTIPIHRHVTACHRERIFETLASFAKRR